jgi:heme/copper-type cytochrome/quinol oxidase subunit 2
MTTAAAAAAPICKTLNNIGKLICNRKGTMISHSAIVLFLIPVVAVSLLGIDSAFAQESPQRYIANRVEIWALFYRLMVVAFVIGAVVMGVVTYVVWRFRESHPKNRGDITPTRTGGAHH